MLTPSVSKHITFSSLMAVEGQREQRLLDSVSFLMASSSDDASLRHLSEPSLRRVDSEASSTPCRRASPGGGGSFRGGSFRGGSFRGGSFSSPSSPSKRRQRQSQLAATTRHLRRKAELETSQTLAKVFARAPPLGRFRLSTLTTRQVRLCLEETGPDGRPRLTRWTALARRIERLHGEVTGRTLELGGNGDDAARGDGSSGKHTRDGDGGGGYRGPPLKIQVDGLLSLVQVRLRMLGEPFLSASVEGLGCQVQVTETDEARAMLAVRSLHADGVGLTLRRAAAAAVPSAAAGGHHPGGYPGAGMPPSRSFVGVGAASAQALPMGGHSVW